MFDLQSRLRGYRSELVVNDQGVWINVPLEIVPARPARCVLADMGDPPESYTIPLPLGKSVRSLFWLDLADAPHALIAGSTGSGKSTLLHACLHFLLPRADVWGIDLKLVELSRYKTTMTRLATEPEGVRVLLAELFYEMQQRLAAMETQGHTQWVGRRLILVIDELAEVTLASKGDTQTLLRFAQTGRAAGIHLILVTQRPSTKIISGDLKANIPLRVAFALPTAVDSRMVLDTDGAAELAPPGDALVLSGHKLTRMSTPYFKPPPPLDTGAADDLRLVGLPADARAAFVALHGKAGFTKRAVMQHFHWGDRRALHALRELRYVGLLDDDAPADDADAPVGDAVPEAEKSLPEAENLVPEVGKLVPEAEKSVPAGGVGGAHPTKCAPHPHTSTKTPINAAGDGDSDSDSDSDINMDICKTEDHALALRAISSGECANPATVLARGLQWPFFSHRRGAEDAEKIRQT